MFRDVLGTVQQLERRHGPVWQTRMGRLRIINLLGPDALELVLKNRDGVFSSARGWEFYISRVFPGAIMAMDGDEHRYQRRIMQVAFRKSALRAYFDQMAPAIDHGLGQWLSGSARADGRCVFPLFKQLTLDLAASVFMGVELGRNATALNRAFVDTVQASLAFVRKPIPGLKMWRGVRGRELLVERFRALLPQKRAVHSSDFFSEFCYAESEQGEKFTDQEIIDHMIFLMMAAHDTTTSTLTTIMYLLARHPHWQDRVRDEARALGKAHLAYDDLDRLESLNWLIREALRLYPPLSSMPRMCMRETAFRDYLHSGEHAGRRLSDSRAPHALAMARSAFIRSGAIQSCAAGRQESSVCVGAVRRRRAHVHRSAFCDAAGQGDHALAAVAVPMERARRLYDALSDGADRQAPGRTAGDVAAGVIGAEARCVVALLICENHEFVICPSIAGTIISWCTSTRRALVTE